MTTQSSIASANIASAKSASETVQAPQNVHSIEQYVQVHHHTRRGVWVLLIGLLGFLAWAIWAPLDEGVPTEGVVSVETNHKVVQHLNGGMVSQLWVREGQEVHQGDLLFKLDDTSTKARYEEIRQRYAGLRAQEGRLQAEKAGLTSIQFHPDLKAQQTDPLIQQHMQNQSQLLMARRSALASDTAARRESIAGQKALIEGYEGVLTSQQAQLALLQDQLNGIKELTKEGFAPRNQQNDLEQKVAAVYGDIANTKANILRANKAILELNQQITTRIQTEKKRDRWRHGASAVASRV